MNGTDWYESWFGSPYYKILYENRDELEAQEFVGNLINYLQPLPGSLMLDIACGEGRYARQWSEHGFDVTGIDISSQSIAKANAFDNDRLHFYVHDMRFPFYVNYFNYAFNFFTSFGYFSNDRDHRMAANSFSAGLRKNGMLVIDYLNYEQVMHRFVAEETVEHSGYLFHIKRKIENNHIVKDIQFADEHGKPKHYMESVAAFTMTNFIRMFKAAGLSLVTIFGDYALRSYDPLDSPRLIMIFKK
jgi:SAM-dependent methyltransferase